VSEATSGSGIQAWTTAVGVLIGWACAVEDVATRRIPNRLVYPLAVFVYAGLVVAWSGGRRPLIAAVAGLVFGVCLLAGSGVLRIGAGDVKLAVPVVALLAWLEVAIFGIAVALLVQSVWALVAQRVRRDGETYVVPLAPAMWVGLIAGIIAAGVGVL